MNITIIAYRPNGEDYCMGSCMARSDSDFDISTLEHDSTDSIDTPKLIEGMAIIIKDYLYDENLYSNHIEVQSWDIVILVDGKEIENRSPYESLRSDAMNLAQKKADLAFIEYKNEKIRKQQVKDEEAEQKATEKRRTDYEELKSEFDK